MRLELSLLVSAAVACGGATPSPAPKLAGQLSSRQASCKSQSRRFPMIWIMIVTAIIVVLISTAITKRR